MQPLTFLGGALLLVVLGTLGFLHLQRRKLHARELYQHYLEDALADGVLTDQEADELESLREKQALSEAEVRMVALSIYRRALQAAVADARVTAEEDETLRRLQELLGLSQVDLRADRQQLQRVHLLARIERGDLPRVNAPVELESGETCHWVVQARIAQRLTIPGPPRAAMRFVEFRVEDNAPFTITDERAALKPREDVLPLDLGMLLITNKRVLFRGARRTAIVPHNKLVSIRLFADGLALEAAAGTHPLLFLVDDAELTAAVLLTAARSRRPDQRGAGRTA